MEQCLKCGKCLSVCPVQQLGYPSFAVFPLYGLKEADIWQCTNCWLCHQACPQSIDLWSVKASLQRDAEHVPEGVQAGYEQIAACGFILPMTEEINLVRGELGLQPFVTPTRQVLAALLDNH